MTARRRAIELSIGEGDLARLVSIARSRTEPASRVERARMLLAYRKDPSFFAVGQALGVHHQTVQRCVERALAYGAMAALDDRPRPGKEPTITAEAKAWLVSLACRKAKDLGYPHEVSSEFPPQRSKTGLRARSGRILRFRQQARSTTAAQREPDRPAVRQFIQNCEPTSIRLGRSVGVAWMGTRDSVQECCGVTNGARAAQGRDAAEPDVRVQRSIGDATARGLQSDDAAT